MAKVVKKTISLPFELAKEVEEIAREERKTLSAVVQEALKLSRKEKLKKEFYQIQDYWSLKAKEKGILTEKDLKRYLAS
jgi:metal-responsive CopG/Arc/MetJ family transcriptional regulator